MGVSYYVENQLPETPYQTRHINELAQEPKPRATEFKFGGFKQYQ